MEKMPNILSKKVIQKAAEESACIMRIEKRMYDWERSSLPASIIAGLIFEDVKGTITKSK